jgi:hypothetical protein
MLEIAELGINGDADALLYGAGDNFTQQLLGDNTFFIIRNDERLNSVKLFFYILNDLLPALFCYGRPLFPVEANNLLIMSNNPGLDGGWPAGLNHDAIDIAVGKFKLFPQNVPVLIIAHNAAQGDVFSSQRNKIIKHIGCAPQPSVRILVENVHHRNGRFRRYALNAALDVFIQH